VYPAPRSILVVTFDVRRRGGIERLSLHVVDSLVRSGARVRLVHPAALFPGTIGRWIGRLIFVCRLVAALPFADDVVSMHGLFLGPVRTCGGALRLLGLCRRQTLRCWLHGIEVWGRALDVVGESLRRCQSLAASSCFTADRVRERAGPWPPISVIHPMADLVEESCVPAALPPRPVLVTIARMDIGWDYKGHGLVLQALARLRDEGALPAELRWDVVGGGNSQAALARRVHALGLGRHVRFLGELSDADARTALESSSVMIMPSAYSVGPDGVAAGEGFGIVYLEAAFAGRASIACRLGGQSDLIEDGVSGLLVDPTPEDVARAIRRAITERGLLEELGAAARARALRDFAAASFDARLREWMGLKGPDRGASAATPRPG
jgi:glycosyltransferase involved in cell wall biosynthesis